MHVKRTDDAHSAVEQARRPSAEVSDIEAIEEVLRGNREMFEVIVRRYNAQLYRVGMAYVRDHSRTEDAMQNAYINAYLHLRQYNRTAGFSTWLTRIMINECLMMLRRAKAHVLEPLDAAIENDPSLSASVTSDEVLTDEMKSLLEKTIADLPESYRVVYMLREVQQLSVAETAECLDISEESVKVILHRARARLRSDLLKSAAGMELFAYPAQYCTPMAERVLRLLQSYTPLQK